jgi:uridine kinase
MYKSNGHKIRVQFEDQQLQVSLGTSVAEVLGQIYIRDHQVVGATLNHHLVSLLTPLDGDSLLEAVVPCSREGQAILRRTATHILHAVFFQHFRQFRLRIGQSLLGGYYYEVLPVEGQSAPDLVRLAEQAQQLMNEMVEQDLTLYRHSISTEAVSDWVDDPFGYKQKLLKAFASPMVQIVELGEYRDLMHGPCAPSTGSLRGAQVLAYPPGLVLRFPQAALTSPLPQPGREDRKLFKSYRETRDWYELIGISAVGDLNAAALEDRFEHVVHLAEALHEKKIAQIADAIHSRRDQVRLVCIAGPSSSGKTTFVKRLSVQLEVNGLRPLTLGLDDFYRERSQAPRDENGDYDFERLEALQLDLLEATLVELLAGREVGLPRYDFESGKRSHPDSWPRVRLNPGQLLVLEGIHGLNPDLAPALPQEARFRIFVSALTQLRIDEHNRVFTSDARLLRRIVRDRRFRGTSATDTIMRWPSVRKGEESYIFPYQDLSDAMFNSALVYETAVLRPYAWRYLLEVPRTHPARVRAYELLKFLELFVPVFPDTIPVNSVLREFIGAP